MAYNRVAAAITFGPSEAYLALEGDVAAPVATSITSTQDWEAAGYDSPGYTEDGISVIYTPTITGIPVDEEYSDVIKYLSGEKLEIKIKMKQASLENLNFAMEE